MNVRLFCVKIRLMKSNASDHSEGSAPKVVDLEVVDSIPGEHNEIGGTGKADAEADPRARGVASNMRFVVGLALAALADGLEVMFPPLWIPIDLAMVGVFFFLWGFRWEVALILLPELIPGANMFPSWTLLALYLGRQGPQKSA